MDAYKFPVNLHQYFPLQSQTFLSFSQASSLSNNNDLRQHLMHFVSFCFFSIRSWAKEIALSCMDSDTDGNKSVFLFV